MNKKSKITKESKEVWKPIRGLERYFAVSSHGRVRSLAREYRAGSRKTLRTKGDVVLQPVLTRNYLYVRLLVADGEFRFDRGVSIHRLVAQEFCENRLGRSEVNHKDGNKMNNHYSNLEWVSHGENMRHAYALGLMPMSKGRMRFDREKILRVFELRKKNYMHKEIAKELGMGVSTVTHILLGSRRAKQ